MRALFSTCTLVTGSESTKLSSALAFFSHSAKSVGAAAEAAIFWETAGAGFPNTCPSPPKAWIPLIYTTV